MPLVSRRYGPGSRVRTSACDAVEARTRLLPRRQPDLVVLGEIAVSDFKRRGGRGRGLDVGGADGARSQLPRRPGPSTHIDGVELFHASARDPVWEYVLTEEAAATRWSSRAHRSFSSDTAMGTRDHA